MKLSEFNAAPREAEDVLPYPRSELADPPITVDEARAAATTKCRLHQLPDEPQSYVEGRVYFCGIGRQYFRSSKRDEKMYAPLHYRW